MPFYWYLSYQMGAHPNSGESIFSKSLIYQTTKTSLHLAQKKRIYMLLLDLFLFVCLILLLSPFSTGLSWHEFLGTIFFLPLILHLLFSWSWIEGSTRRFLNKSNWRERFNYFLNLAFFVFVVLEIVSGLIVSQVLVPFIGIKTINDDAWRGLHKQVSVGIVILISMHISLNWQRMVSYFRKRISPSNKKNEMRRFSLILKIQAIRVTIVIIATVIITSLGYLVLGAPVMSRVSAVNDIARFRSNPIAGTAQVMGAAICIFILAYISWRWLRVRL